MSKEEMFKGVDLETLNRIRIEMGDQEFINQWKLTELEYDWISGKKKFVDDIKKPVSKTGNTPASSTTKPASKTGNTPASSTTKPASKTGNTPASSTTKPAAKTGNTPAPSTTKPATNEP
jgi:hypothetical protein